MNDFDKTLLLSRIDLDEDKKEKQVSEVESILNYVNVVNSVEGDLDSFPNMSGNYSVFRKDNPKNSLNIKNIKGNAPKMSKDFFELEGIF